MAFFVFIKTFSVEVAQIVRVLYFCWWSSVFMLLFSSGHKMPKNRFGALGTNLQLGICSPPPSFEVHNLHSPNIDKSHENNNDINNGMKLKNCNMFREGAKNTLRGVPRIARPSVASGSPPLSGARDYTPPSSVARHQYPPVLTRNIMHPIFVPH